MEKKLRTSDKRFLHRSRSDGPVREASLRTRQRSRSGFEIDVEMLRAYPQIFRQTAGIFGRVFGGDEQGSIFWRDLKSEPKPTQPRVP